MFELLLFISANGLFLILTPISVVWLIFSQNRNTNKVAKRVEEVRKTTALSAELAAKKVAATILERDLINKKDLDEKLEVIRLDVNSNLTAALNEIESLKERLGITEENPQGVI